MYLSQLIRQKLCLALKTAPTVRSFERASLCCIHKPSTISFLQRHRFYSTDKRKTSVVKSANSADVSTTVSKVAEASKTATYTAIILIGVGVTGAILYTIFSELFSGKSPNNVYAKAFKRCVNDEKVIFALGEPIKGHGEETRRGRRQHVQNLFYMKDGLNYLRIKFYLKGARKNATVHAEVKENKWGMYDYRYLFVQLDDYPKTTIVLEDNRVNASILAPEPDENFIIR